MPFCEKSWKRIALALFKSVAEPTVCSGIYGEKCFPPENLSERQFRTRARSGPMGQSRFPRRNIGGADPGRGSNSRSMGKSVSYPEIFQNASSKTGKFRTYEGKAAPREEILAEPIWGRGSNSRSMGKSVSQQEMFRWPIRYGQVRDLWEKPLQPHTPVNLAGKTQCSSPARRVEPEREEGCPTKQFQHKSEGRERSPAERSDCWQ
jgi:hypothetical protein